MSSAPNRGLKPKARLPPRDSALTVVAPAGGPIYTSANSRFANGNVTVTQEKTHEGKIQLEEAHENYSNDKVAAHPAPDGIHIKSSSEDAPFGRNEASSEDDYDPNHHPYDELRNEFEGTPSVNALSSDSIYDLKDDFDDFEETVEAEAQVDYAFLLKQTFGTGKAIFNTGDAYRIVEMKSDKLTPAEKRDILDFAESILPHEHDISPFSIPQSTRRIPKPGDIGIFPRAELLGDPRSPYAVKTSVGSFCAKNWPAIYMYSCGEYGIGYPITSAGEQGLIAMRPDIREAGSYIVEEGEPTFLDAKHPTLEAITTAPDFNILPGSVVNPLVAVTIPHKDNWKKKAELLPHDVIIFNRRVANIFISHQLKMEDLPYLIEQAQAALKQQRNGKRSLCDRISYDQVASSHARNPTKRVRNRTLMRQATTASRSNWTKAAGKPKRN